MFGLVQRRVRRVQVLALRQGRPRLREERDPREGLGRFCICLLLIVVCLNNYV